METDSIECITPIDGMEEDEIQQSIHHPGSHHHLHPHHHQQFSSSKGHANNGVGVVSPGIIPSTTRVHELLECPVCTNSMYPPIYQVFHCFGQYLCLHFEAFQLGMAPVYMAFLRFMGDEMEARNYSYSLEVRTLSETVRLDARTNTVGWSATSGQVDNWVYEEANTTFIQDEEMLNRLMNMNPNSLRKLVQTFLEANGREYWETSEQNIERLRQLYSEVEDKIEGIDR
ncbi:hypothetical protein MLD38_000532 [Melastoma candidum]|uniref:Uncharacterized protein n=1 Tax=Melastoma candidum TaxID=119954 RepID=A0ACB9SAV2_9MYRT|nr:hypothetical protein MLD38_000532 [Melastoma candidum]